MFTLIVSVKLVAEIALMALAGQAVLGVLAGANRYRNPFYLLLRQVSHPFLVLARWLTPRVVLERHLPIVAFLLLAFLWLITTAAKISWCVEQGVRTCQ